MLYGWQKNDRSQIHGFSGRILCTRHGRSHARKRRDMLQAEWRLHPRPQLVPEHRPGQQPRQDTGAVNESCHGVQQRRQVHQRGPRPQQVGQRHPGGSLQGRQPCRLPDPDVWHCPDEAQQLLCAADRRHQPARLSDCAPRHHDPWLRRPLRRWRPRHQEREDVQLRGRVLRSVQQPPRYGGAARHRELHLPGRRRHQPRGSLCRTHERQRAAAQLLCEEQHDRLQQQKRCRGRWLGGRADRHLAHRELLRIPKHREGPGRRPEALWIHRGLHRQRGQGQPRLH